MKVWWLSKTLWVNFIALVAAILQAKFGFVLEPTTQVMILTTINLILRCVTKDPIGLQ
jgi:hypothetical protein